jgi:hypothetical protein
MPEGKEDEIQPKVGTFSYADAEIEAKAGNYAGKVKIAWGNNFRGFSIRRGSTKSYPLMGDKYTILIRRQLNGLVRYAIIDNSTGITVQMGEV